RLRLRAGRRRRRRTVPGRAGAGVPDGGRGRADRGGGGADRPAGGAGARARGGVGGGGRRRPGRPRPVGPGRRRARGHGREVAGPEYAVAAGLGTASVREGGATVGAMVAANPAGGVIGADGTVLAGSRAPAGLPGFPVPTPFENTTLVVVATDARVGKNECALLAQSAHDGLAQAIRPAHTRYDGDFAAVLATGEVEAHPDRPRV